MRFRPIVLSVASLATYLILVAPAAALGQGRPAPADAFGFLIGNWRADVRIPLADRTVVGRLSGYRQPGSRRRLAHRTIGSIT